MSLDHLGEQVNRIAVLEEEVEILTTQRDEIRRNADSLKERESKIDEEKESIHDDKLQSEAEIERLKIDL
jgi:prefoldin subunit 5